MQYEELMQQQAGGSDLYTGNAPNSRGGAEAYRQRALEMHNELLELERQYGNAAIIPRAVAARVQHLAQQREHAINAWQEYDNHAVADSISTDASRGSFKENRTSASLFQQPQAAVNPNKSIAERLQDRSMGLRSMNPPAAPAQRVAGKVFGDSPDMPQQPQPQQQSRPMAGGTTPQFGHAPQKPWMKKPNPGMY